MSRLYFAMRKLFVLILMLLFYKDLNAQNSKCISGDCQNGFGIMVDAQGRYEGIWKNGQKNGQFKYLFKSGNKFEGTVVNDLIEGEGSYTTSSYTAVGYLYEQKSTKGFSITLNGKGQMIYTNGAVYKGIFKNNKLDGQGVYQGKDHVYEGSFINGIWNGKGVLKTNEGDIYEGDFVNGKLQGKGMFKYSNGDVYVGEFLNGRPGGKGIFKYSNGYVYEGVLTDGIPNGMGVMKYLNGDIYEGEWVKGLRAGFGKLIYQHGAIRQGKWLEDSCIECDTKNAKSPNEINLNLNESGLGYNLLVNFDGVYPSEMLLDTGADRVLLKKETMESLLKLGKIRVKDEEKESEYIDAGGHKNNSKVFIVNSINIGNFVIRDVECEVNVNTNKSPNLLGMNAIRKLGKQIKIDLINSILIVD